MVPTSDPVPMTCADPLYGLDRLADALSPPLPSGGQSPATRPPSGDGGDLGTIVARRE